jgi:hypothetical protein
MPRLDEFPTEDELRKKHESRAFPGSNDTSMSTYGAGLSLEVNRPKEDDMYSLFITGKDGIKKEVAMIGGSTAEAEKVFDKAKEILKMNLKPEELEQKIRDYIIKMHGGLQN